jgi:hypothetical protein
MVSFIDDGGVSYVYQRYRWNDVDFKRPRPLSWRLIMYSYENGGKDSVARIDCTNSLHDRISFTMESTVAPLKPEIITFTLSFYYSTEH